MTKIKKLIDFLGDLCQNKLRYYVIRQASKPSGSVCEGSNPSWGRNLKSLRCKEITSKIP
jgi:hypothetical protein